jgi:hypothetical protein
LNTHENDSSEESCEAIQLAVMPVFGILKHLIEVSKTFSAHNNLSSQSSISDTFVLYTQINETKINNELEKNPNFALLNSERITPFFKKWQKALFRNPL